MNKQGFTLVELLAVIIIISLVLMVVYPSVTNISKNNSDSMYHEYENMMIEYAKISSLNNNDVINLNNLDELDKVKKECSGYVTINHNSNPTIYKAYIKCDNKYQTTGYNDSTVE